MATVSLCMIVKDEGETLRRCLDSAKGLVDEIVVVDTGSGDDTVSIAREYTDKVYEFDWIEDFSAARNYSFSKAEMDYILWLDADDVIEEDQWAPFRALVEMLDIAQPDAVMMRYNIAFDGVGRPTFSYYRERLVRRASGPLWMEPVHEYIQVGGKMINSEVAVSHRKPPSRDAVKSDRNLRIYERELKEKGQLSPRGQYYYARELMEHGRWRAAVAGFELFLRGGKGWVEDCIQACLEIGRCYMELKEEEQALGALVRSFVYDTPRGEVCCRIGYVYKGRGDHRRAAFWFGLVEGLPRPEGRWGFVREDDWGYVPAVESCVCWYALGDMGKAREWNAKAERFKPESEAVQWNWGVFGRE